MNLKQKINNICEFIRQESIDKLVIVITVIVLFSAVAIAWLEPDISFVSGIWWSIVTLTTVGYGDIAPQTVLGQTLASFIMIIGYAIIAVPTGIISVEMSKAQTNTKVCQECQCSDHEDNAKFCKNCGASVN